MRCKGIKVTFEVPICRIDGNGRVYDLESYNYAAKDMVGVPITNGSGDICYGIVTEAYSSSNEMITLEGMLFSGGTTELTHNSVEFERTDNDNGITDVNMVPVLETEKILSFALAEDWSNNSDLEIKKEFNNVSRE